MTIEGVALVTMAKDDGCDVRPWIFAADLLALWKQHRLMAVDVATAARLESANGTGTITAPEAMAFIDTLAAKLKGPPA
jgi:hypothetical protein